MCEGVTSGTNSGRKLGVHFFCHICPIIRREVRKCLVELTDLLLAVVCGGRWGLSAGKGLHSELIVQRGAANYAGLCKRGRSEAEGLGKPLKTLEKQK